MMFRRDSTFVTMARAYPLRTGIFTALPVIAVLAQFGNTYYHGFPILYAILFAVVILTVAVVFTQQQLAAYRLSRLHDAWM